MKYLQNSAHWIAAVAVLSGVICLNGCRSGLMIKRESELSCPTDIRHKVPWCAGEDAIFYCPCGPDSDFYGMKPTCWGEWPTSGVDWRNAFCGVPAEMSSLSTDEAVTEVPMPTALDGPGEFYNPFGDSLKSIPPGRSANEPIELPVPDGKPQSMKEVEDPNATLETPEVSSKTDANENLNADNKQGIVRPLPVVKPNGHTNAMQSAPKTFRSKVPAHPQTTPAQFTLPTAPVADKPSGVILAELRQQAYKLATSSTQDKPKVKLTVLDSPTPVVVTQSSFISPVSGQRKAEPQGPIRPTGSKVTGDSKTFANRESTDAFVVANSFSESAKSSPKGDVPTALIKLPARPSLGEGNKTSVRIKVIPNRLPPVELHTTGEESIQIRKLDHASKQNHSPLFAK